jgi:hypothetical protein
MEIEFVLSLMLLHVKLLVGLFNEFVMVLLLLKTEHVKRGWRLIQVLKLACDSEGN